MKKLSLVYVVALLLWSTSGLHAQATGEVKHFDTDGVAFDYPAKWALQDASSAVAQQLTLTMSDSDAQMKVTIYRGRLSTPERIAEARKQLVDPYIESNVRTFQQMGANPQRSPASATISGVNADGAKISAVLGGEPGAAFIYSVVLGERLVVLTLFGPDRALKQAAPLWDAVRNSLLIKPPAAAKPSPK